MRTSELIGPVKTIARAAADRILEVYGSDFGVEQKADTSPLTQADLAAHTTICEALARLTPQVPILSEESADIPFATRRRWTRYWLVDPLDGTKEFIKRNGEFTVNIALVEAGRAVLGVVHVPVTGRCYSGVIGGSAEVQEGESAARAISVRALDERQVSVAGSRSHGNAATSGFIASLERRFGTVTLRSIGSSLKFCLVAEGAVDIYPRFGPTSEWDTAAAQAVVEAAGGHVVDTTLAPLRYNTKDSVLNPYFMVFGDDAGEWAQFIPAEVDRET